MNSTKNDSLIAYDAEFPSSKFIITYIVYKSVSVFAWDGFNVKVILDGRGTIYIFAFA